MSLESNCLEEVGAARRRLLDAEQDVLDRREALYSAIRAASEAGLRPDVIATHADVSRSRISQIAPSSFGPGRPRKERQA